MSLLLDVVLFIRKNSKTLSFVERIVLTSLAGRIGNNDDTWISQGMLAEECNITTRYLSNALHSLSDKNIININKSNGKNRYSFLIERRNYSSAIEEKIPIEDRNYSSYSVEEYRNCSSYDLPTTGTTVPMINDLSTGQDIEYTEKNDESEIPKATLIKQIYNKIKATTADVPVSLPNFLPQEEWNDFLAHRKALKSPMGAIAQKRAISSLARLHEQGQDVLEIIDQSIVNGWKGLFPVKRQGASNGNYQAKSRAQTELSNYWEYLNQMQRDREAYDQQHAAH